MLLLWFPLNLIKAAVDSHLDVSDYGHSIFSGWGEDPPRKTEKLLRTYGPTSGLVCSLCLLP